MTAKALTRYRPEEMPAGPLIETDEQLIREIGNIAITIFHPVGTCSS